MKKIRKGDLVVVLTGRDKGRQGLVLSRVNENKLIVEGVGVVTKSTPSNPSKGTIGGFVKKSMPKNDSNFAIVNPVTGRPDRVGVKIVVDLKTGESKRIRICKSNGVEILG
jgi:large subunit ribosomal protein L24